MALCRRSGFVALLLLLTLSVAAHDLPTETAEIAGLIDLRPGMTLADVGAGDGELAEAIATELNDSGHVYLTEIDDGELRKLRRRVADSRATNMSVVEGKSDDTGLPDASCHVILLRYVYHHFDEPEAMRASLRRSLKPGGLLLIIEKDEYAHGIPLDDLLDQVDDDGFRLISCHQPWGEHQDHHAALFRRTEH